MATAAEKVVRDEQIFLDRMRPMSWRKLQEKYGLSNAHLRRIVNERKEAAPKLTEVDPFDIIWESIERYEQWIEQLTEIAVESENDNAKVGAINAQARLQGQRDDLLQKSGVLPQNLGKLKVEHDIRFLAQIVVQVLREDNVALATQKRILNALRSGSPDGN